MPSLFNTTISPSKIIDSLQFIIANDFTVSMISGYLCAIVFPLRKTIIKIPFVLCKNKIALTPCHLTSKTHFLSLNDRSISVASIGLIVVGN